MTKQSDRIISHALGWLGLFLLPIIFSQRVPHSLHDVFNPNAVRDYVIILLLMGFFYFNYWVLVPEFYFRRKYFIYVLCILLAYIVTSVIPPMVISYRQHMMPFFFDTFHNIFVFLAILFISFNLRINRQWKLAEKERLTAELSNLKVQMQPHFLFNTLNTIYSLSIAKSEVTSSAIVMLSNLMRYVLSDAQMDYVAIEKELSYLSDYIELQKLRLGNTVKIDFSVTGKPECRIAPLVLIPFVENAFKYGVNPEENSHISIRIGVDKNQLSMVVTNNKVSYSKNGIDPGGIGIENVRKRLQLLYPSAHTLVILDKENQFVVELKITCHD